jgi:hypothetical protein
MSFFKRTLALLAPTVVAMSISCSEDDATSSPGSPVLSDAAAGDGDDTTDGSMGPGPTTDASTGNDTDSSVASGPVSFTVPTAGGTISVTGDSGHAIAFAFPASAAGRNITLSVSSASAIGWPAGSLEDVIQMEPDGTVFDDPVVVTPESGNVLAFSFPSSATQTAPEGLSLNAEGTGILLNHFSTLAFVPVAQSCEGASGWVVADDSSACADFADTQLITFSCDGSSFCYQIEASCCAPLDAQGCSLAYPAVQVSYTHTGSNGGEYPYCGSDDAGAGSDTGDASVAPTILSLEPSSGPVGTSVTVTGEGFDVYFGTATNRFVAGFDFEDANGDAVSPGEPTPATQENDLNIMHFDVPNLALGSYDVRMKFRDGSKSANTLPFEITQ